MAQEYMKTLKPGTAARTFCEIPHALAEATITIIEQGLPKVIHFFIYSFRDNKLWKFAKSMYDGN